MRNRGKKSPILKRIRAEIDPNGGIDRLVGKRNDNGGRICDRPEYEVKEPPLEQLREYMENSGFFDDLPG